MADNMAAPVFQRRRWGARGDLLDGLMQQPRNAGALSGRRLAEVSGAGVDRENKMAHFESRRRSIMHLARVDTARARGDADRMGRDIVGGSGRLMGRRWRGRRWLLKALD